MDGSGRGRAGEGRQPAGLRRGACSCSSRCGPAARTASRWWARWSGAGSRACCTPTSTIRRGGRARAARGTRPSSRARSGRRWTAEPFAALAHRPALTMLGRTYASRLRARPGGLAARRPRRTVLDPAWPWAIWYPLRRAGAFARLTPQEQGAILAGARHASGAPTATADLAHDVRLACHGLDTHDNDFVIGLIGPGAPPAVPPGAGHAAHRADLAVPREPRPILRGPRALAEPRRDEDPRAARALGSLLLLSALLAPAGCASLPPARPGHRHGAHRRQVAGADHVRPRLLPALLPDDQAGRPHGGVRTG